MIVVKLGGSLAEAGTLRGWLVALTRGMGRAVVVPGGGAFAEAVREQQRHLRFSDRAAHRMALLAMDQLAWAVAGLRPGFAVGATEGDLLAALDRGSFAIWAPYALIAGRTDIEESWRLTSDSLALWLATRVGASRYYLIKSILRQKTRLSAEQLSRDGIIDEAFLSMLKAAFVPAFLLGRGDQEAFSASLARVEDCGAEIDELKCRVHN